MLTPALTRSDRTDKRNQRLKDAFYQRYTRLPRPKPVSREHVVHQLADEFYLSVKTVERVLLGK